MLFSRAIATHRYEKFVECKERKKERKRERKRERERERERGDQVKKSEK